MANNCPSLGVGCHVVLVDGQPVLPPQDVPSLADPVTGEFRSSFGEFARWLYTDRSARFSADQIEAEAAAQIRLLQNRGVRLTHIDTHKHTHVFPAVLRPVLRAAHKAGIRAVRNPFEPLWSVRATPGAPWLRRTGVDLLRRWLHPGFKRAIAEEGFVTTDGTISMSATGTLDAKTLTSLLADVPEGTWELVTHPGYWDDELAQVKTRLKQSRDTERITLPMLKQIPGIELISFRNLTGTGVP
jgi:predicted glycoside hydrolase/deacetylase ChbG (UPF0249 family)